MKNGLRKALDHLRLTVMSDGLSDAQLLKGFIAEHDEAAFAALVRRHGPMVLGVCWRILGNAHDTDDAFQATFLVLVQKAGTLANRQALASWLYTVAHRTALEARSRNARRHLRERQVEEMPHPEIAAAEAGDWQPVLDQELSRLPEKYRAPVILCELEGRPRRDAARQLGLAEGTLSSRLAAARRMLARRLARHGITLSGGALAVAVSEASAAVPSSLASSTTKAALLVAAGQLGALVTPAAILSKGVIKAMFISKLKGTLAAVCTVLVLGAGSLVYSQSGGRAGNPAEKTLTPLEALRRENELLKLNLRVTLEKIQAMEAEIKNLKVQARTGATRNHDTGFIVETVFDEKLFNKPGEQPARTDKVDIALPRELTVLENGLNALRKNADEKSRQQALDQIEQAVRKLRGQPKESDLQVK
jgi:RNA polymerase sigma factor (sigma-70 family)